MNHEFVALVAMFVSLVAHAFVPSLMVGFAILDLTFAGFRAAAGRDGRIAKGGYYAGAMAKGALAGVFVALVMGLLTWGALSWAPDGVVLYSELNVIGAAMAKVFAGYAAVVSVALLVYTFARHEVRTLATVAILGPFTLARPLVVLAALGVGLFTHPPTLSVAPTSLSPFSSLFAPLTFGTFHSPVAIGLTGLSCGMVLLTGVLLDWHYAAVDPSTPRAAVSAWQRPTSALRAPGLFRALELGRPLLFLAAFLLLTGRFGWKAAPFAGVVVFAFAILVHDLIHNALYLPGVWSRIALSMFAQVLLKSGHALRTTHVLHHQRCLQGDDEEGGVVHLSVGRLVLLGPWLAVRARWTAFREGGASRRIQVFETALNLALFGALVAASWRGSVAALSYLGAVIFVTFTAPLWGAKIPHTLPTSHPVVRWLSRHIGRLTPAACSVIFHELHHRSPRTAVSLLALHQHEISARPPSPCQDPPEPTRPPPT